MSVDALQRIVLENLEVGWESGYGDMWKCDQRMGSITVVVSLWRGELPPLLQLEFGVLKHQHLPP